MTLRVLVVDDEPLARRGILARLRRAGGVEVVGECAGGREAVEAIRGLAPDLVFLDVQMPGTDGFGVVEAVGPERVPEVVFVTAYDEHALRAFDARALDYLLKPVDDERFARALERARRRVEERRHGALGRRVAAALAEAGGPPPPPAAAERPAERFLVPRGGRVQVVHADEIDWVEAAGDYVSLHAGGATHLLRETMAAMEARLDPRASSASTVRPSSTWSASASCTPTSTASTSSSCATAPASSSAARTGAASTRSSAGRRRRPAPALHGSSRAAHGSPQGGRRPARGRLPSSVIRFRPSPHEPNA